MRALLISTLVICGPGLLACSAEALDPEAMHGEWALSAEDCRESRLTFTETGHHRAIMWDGERWETLASTPYRVEGTVVTIGPGESDPETQTLQLVELSKATLILETADAARAQIAGTNRLELLRCEAR